MRRGKQASTEYGVMMRPGPDGDKVIVKPPGRIPCMRTVGGKKRTGYRNVGTSNCKITYYPNRD